MSGLSRKWTRIGVGLIGVAIIVSGAAVWIAYRTARGNLSESRCDGHTRFVRNEWMDTSLAYSRLAVRGCMVDDLLERYELRGMTRAEVVALIGEPPKSDYFRSYDLVYWLGPERGLIGIDSEWLVMKLDANKRVTSVELVTD